MCLQLGTLFELSSATPLNEWSSYLLTLLHACGCVYVCVKDLRETYFFQTFIVLERKYVLSHIAELFDFRFYCIVLYMWVYVEKTIISIFS